MTRANGGSVQLRCHACGQRFPCPSRRTPMKWAPTAVPLKPPSPAAAEPAAAGACALPVTGADRESDGQDGPIVMLLLGGLTLAAAVAWTRGRRRGGRWQPS